ncbi:hypothetical protein TRFO_32652 [Tritrichomonas foetus]|uniref:Uncharacterized protein n=1 Tax=Tritrichomonas foetus TaxID=1144522 RepID=A0A1J4JTN0_9EUKA|nr:hypothetical protein TRFO_32652 [Tritrichomonas foetus]|eukprot:OHT00629.1 hypothetical protein TRFO_32652 [Tritrichomonas foetus]
MSLLNVKHISTQLIDVHCSPLTLCNMISKPLNITIEIKKSSDQTSFQFHHFHFITYLNGRSKLLNMSVERERRRKEHEIIRENAASWREEPLSPVRTMKSRRSAKYQNDLSKSTKKRQTNFNSNLKTSELRAKKTADLWDQDGNLIESNVKLFKQNEEGRSTPKRAQSVKKGSTTTLVHPQPFSSRVPKTKYEYEKTNQNDDQGVEFEKRNKFEEAIIGEILKTNPDISTEDLYFKVRDEYAKKIKEISFKLSTVRTQTKRERSVQPIKKSTDFPSFLERQKRYLKTRAPKQQEEYKIEMSEGSKKMVSERNYKHSVTDCVKKRKEEERIKREKEEMQPKINKKRSFRLQNQEYEQEKEAKMILLRTKNDIDIGAIRIPDRRPLRSFRDLSRESESRLREDSIFAERFKISEKVKEMEPIFDAEEDEMKRIAELKNKKKRYMPKYIKEICDTIRNDPDRNIVTKTNRSIAETSGKRK